MKTESEEWRIEWGRGERGRDTHTNTHTHTERERDESGWGVLLSISMVHRVESAMAICPSPVGRFCLNASVPVCLACIVRVVLSCCRPCCFCASHTPACLSVILSFLLPACLSVCLSVRSEVWGRLYYLCTTLRERTSTPAPFGSVRFVASFSLRCLRGVRGGPLFYLTERRDPLPIPMCFSLSVCVCVCVCLACLLLPSSAFCAALHGMVGFLLW